METLCFIIFVLITISISVLIKAIHKKPSQTLPPGLNSIITNIIWIMRTSSELESIVRNLHKKLGPIVTLNNIFSRPAIFVSDRSLAHQALIQNGALFADRPEPLPVGKVITCNQHNINSASYGPVWRLLRRNLTAEILHPSRIKSYSHARKWVLRSLLDSLMSNSKTGEVPVRVVDHFQYAMFCLLVLMCFGDKPNQEKIKEIENIQRRLLLDLSGRFNMLNFWPNFITLVLLRKRWKEFFQVVEEQEKVLVPLIRSRQKVKQGKGETEDEEYVLSYVDTLLDVQLHEEQRKLTEQEIVRLSSEFLQAGTDTTFTVLQWIMANMVKYPDIQEKLFMEIKGVVGVEEEDVKEDDLQKMPYLKAVILEGLRRHPPGHFVLPHSVREDTVLGGFLVPKNATINFHVSEMGWDPKEWENPMAFKPERFLKNDNKSLEVFDITGSREIKMMPFGVGRRICPGLGLAMLHLEYFVANLVWNFEWKAMDGDEVSLEEKQEFTVVMKTPLQANIYPRKKIR